MTIAKDLVISPRTADQDNTGRPGLTSFFSFGSRDAAGSHGIQCHILRSIGQVEAIAAEWRDLHARAGEDPFNDYDIVHAWWRTTGVGERKASLHIVTARRQGRLVAVLPLIVERLWGLRVIRTVGNNSERFCNVLYDDDAAVDAVWKATHGSRHYDFAICRGVYAGSRNHQALTKFAQPRDVLDEYRLISTWPDSKSWMASLSQKTRYNFNRCVRKLSEKGPVKFETYQGGAVPTEIIDAMITAKRQWAAATKTESWINHPATAGYFQTVSSAAATNGRLFLSWLKCGDDLIAFQHGYVFGQTLYGEFISYRQDWWQFSPGHVINVHKIQWAIDRGFTTINFGPGDSAKRGEGENQFKDKYANHTEVGYEFTFSKSLRGKLLESAYFGARKLWRNHWKRYQSGRAPAAS